ncbi:spike base protein, RCAP_Rcc01079 family [Falsirhodobacter sp. 20TX0035]|uniref:spike base protein, RCAP_Rcc01079 family n=1 Tax=Falsirhodobacter sp. 20TX0035 TaxID=3022019 RepID=UPI002330FB9F|nr:hypothetical protein [Falsirhodobacter sp. 20TX0035]MDB6453479.1 hypothetical protein [Falsirhodobacter sp. 20TX0035]
MANRFAGAEKGVTAAAFGAVAVTPSDSADLAEDVRALTIGTAGTVRYVSSDGVTYATAELPIGTYPMFARRILATGTTAGKITGWI